MRSPQNNLIPVSFIIDELEKRNANFDIIEDLLHETIEREKAILDVTSSILTKDDIYEKKTGIYEVQILLTAIRNRHLAR